MVIVKATKTIAKGHLTVAMGITTHTHMRMHHGDGNASKLLNHPHDVSCIVSWPVSAQEQAVGIEDEVHQYQIWVQPELKLPKPTLGQGVEMQ